MKDLLNIIINSDHLKILLYDKYVHYAFYMFLFCFTFDMNIDIVYINWLIMIFS